MFPMVRGVIINSSLWEDEYSKKGTGFCHSQLWIYLKAEGLSADPNLPRPVRFACFCLNLDSFLSCSVGSFIYWLAISKNQSLHLKAVICTTAKSCLPSAVLHQHSDTGNHPPVHKHRNFSFVRKESAISSLQQGKALWITEVNQFHTGLRPEILISSSWTISLVHCPLLDPDYNFLLVRFSVILCMTVEEV